MRLSILLFCLLTFVVLVLSSCEQSMLDQGSTNSVNSPTNSTDYRSIARQDAIDAHIRADYFVAQINQESGFRPDVVSYAGAIGIAQIMKSTADSWNVNPWDPIASLKVASQHMAWYQNTYGSYEKALACYNAGYSSLLYAESHCTDFYWCLPAQTRGYITNITGYV